MRKIVKTQIFGAFRRIDIVYGIMFSLVIVISAWYSELATDGTLIEVSASEVLSNSDYFGILNFLIFYISSYVFCLDLGSKQIYIEVSSGISRWKAILGRFIAAIIISVAISFLITYLGIVPFYCLHGWGDYLTIKEFMIKMLMYFVFILRVCSLALLLSFIFKNVIVSISIYFGMCIVQIFGLYFVGINYSVDNAVNLFLDFDSIHAILGNYEKYHYEVGKGLITENMPILPNNLIVMYFAVSFVLIFAMVFLSYWMFKKKDLV